MPFLAYDEGKVIVQTSVEQSALGQQYTLVDAFLHEQHILLLTFPTAHLCVGIWFVVARTSQRPG